MRAERARGAAALLTLVCVRCTNATLAGGAVAPLRFDLQHYIGHGYGDAYGRFRHPTYVTVHPSSGDLIVSDSWNHRLQIFSPTGALRRVVGGFGVARGQFWQPQGLAANRWSLFVADTMNHRIQKLNIDTLAPLATAGSYGSGAGQLSFPRGIAVCNFTIFVADSHNSRISIFTAGKLEYAGSFGRRGTGPGELSHPEGLAYVEGRSELFVADSGNDRIAVFDLQGRFLRAFGVEGSEPGNFMLPVGLAAAHGRLYVGEFYGGRLQVLTTEGKPLETLNLGAVGKLSGLSVCTQKGAIYAVDEDWAIVHVMHVRSMLVPPERGEPSKALRADASAGGKASSKRHTKQSHATAQSQSAGAANSTSSKGHHARAARARTRK